ncbi:MAG: hypothetical protein ABIE25_06855 [Thermoplasmatota archaeon]
MVDLDEAIVARYESHGESFEILIDPAIVLGPEPLGYYLLGLWRS